MKKSNNNIIESYRRLCNIIEGHSDIRSISFTSNSDIEGKNTIAKNFAMTIAKSGKKTLFIDCNLYNNSNIKGFNSSKANGLIGILKGIKDTYISDFELKNYISDTEQDHLSMLTLGAFNLDNYSSIFRTEYLKLAIERLKLSYDYIIIDAPSFENLSYSQIVALATDKCLFVLKEGINEVAEGEYIKEKIDSIRCKMLGCILDKEKKSTKVFNDKFNFLNTEYKSKKNKSKKNKDIVTEA